MHRGCHRGRRGVFFSCFRAMSHDSGSTKCRRDRTSDNDPRPILIVASEEWLKQTSDLMTATSSSSLARPSSVSSAASL